MRKSNADKLNPEGIQQQQAIMGTYTQILYQLVFSTKNRENTLIKSGQEHLYRFIHGILKKKGCHLYRIGGVENHLHIVTHIHPAIAPSYLIKDIKLATTVFIKEEKIFPQFNGWQVGFGAFTYSHTAKDRLIDYVRTQELHHKKLSFRDEYIALLREHDIVFEERYLF